MIKLRGYENYLEIKGFLIILKRNVEDILYLNVYIAYSISGERTEKKDKYQLAEIIKYYNEIEENDPNLGEEMKKRESG